MRLTEPTFAVGELGVLSIRGALDFADRSSKFFFGFCGRPMRSE